MGGTAAPTAARPPATALALSCPPLQGGDLPATEKTDAQGGLAAALAGAQALPIVTLISFLVGVILAFVGAVLSEADGYGAWCSCVSMAASRLMW